MISIDKVMTTDLFTQRKEGSMANAIQMWKEHWVRHIPVIDDEKHLIGSITQCDILTTILSHISVADAMRSAELMLRHHKIGSLPVIREGLLVGIITETDYIG
tara:strand:- start:297 stop:605 length:309 start_codon:yes stop_codon:yes gene_type:complete